MCLGRQAFGWFGHGIGAGQHRDEAVRAVVIGQATSAAGEVGVERGVVCVDRVVIAPGGIRLPDLDQLTAKRFAIRPEHAPGHDDPLALRLAGVLSREICVGISQRAVAVDGAGQLGERRGHDHEWLLGRAEPRAHVVGVQVRRVRLREGGVRHAGEGDLRLHGGPPGRCRTARSW